MPLIEDWLIEDPLRIIRACRNGWEGEPKPFLVQKFKTNLPPGTEEILETLGSGKTIEEAIINAIKKGIK